MSVQPANSVLVGPRERADILSRRAVAFLIPVTFFVHVSVIGTIYAPELLLLAALPALFRERRASRLDAVLRTTIVLGAIWLWAQVTSDFWNGSVPHDFLRGWADIIFALTNLAAIALLLRGDRELHVYFAWGLLIGQMTTQFVDPSPLAASNPWKFGLGGPVTVGLALFVSRKRIYERGVLSIVAMTAMGATNLILGFRSLAGICVLTAVYLVVQQRVGRRSFRERRISITRLTLVCVGGLVVTLFFFNVYAHYAKSGALGKTAQQKYLVQETTGKRLAPASGPFAVLVGGRPEIYASLLAIRDSPLLGHGSWAHGEKYVDDVRRAFAPRAWIQPNDQIPSHSELFGAWVDAGIAGALFWAWLAFVGVRLLTGLIRTRDPLTPFFVMVVTLFLWDVFFSPFGADRRLTVPFFISVLALGIAAVRGGGAETPSATQQ